MAKSDEIGEAVLGTASLSIDSDNIPELVIEPFGNNVFTFNLKNMPNTPLRLIIKSQESHMLHNNEHVEIQISVAVINPMRLS